MKKMITVIMVLLILTGMAECHNATPSVTETGESATFPSPTCSVTPPSPLPFHCMEEAIKFLEKNDLSEIYEPEDSLKFYRDMMDSFRKESFVLYPENEVAGIEKNGYGVVQLYPQMTTEDMGIGYHFQYDGKQLYVMVYTIMEGEEYRIDFPQEGYAEYRLKRFHKASDTAKILNVPDVPYRQLYLDRHNQCIFGFIDETHYFKVTYYRADEETFMKFLSGLSFRKIPLNLSESETDS